MFYLVHVRSKICPIPVTTLLVMNVPLIYTKLNITPVGVLNGLVEQ